MKPRKQTLQTVSSTILSATPLSWSIQRGKAKAMMNYWLMCHSVVWTATDDHLFSPPVENKPVFIHDIQSLLFSSSLIPKHLPYIISAQHEKIF